jgi:hypothetical protein
MNQGTIAGVIADAEMLAAELAELCAGNLLAVPYLIRLGFEDLLNLIEALPPDTSNMKFLRNWTRSSRELWEKEEGQAASYQLAQMRRKLGRLKEDGTVVLTDYLESTL